MAGRSTGFSVGSWVRAADRNLDCPKVQATETPDGS